MISDLTQNLSYVESFFVKVSIQSKIFIVASAYIPPSSEIKRFMSIFDSLRHFKVQSTDLIVSGDYNIDLLKFSVSEILAVKFFKTVNSLSMVSIITTPTRIDCTSCILLDIFLIFWVQI